MVVIWLLAACLALAPFAALGADETHAVQRQAFSRAWQAAARGDRAGFESLLPQLSDYLLYPYLQYEDLRQRRASVPDREMIGFLEDHPDWAFTSALRESWLRALAEEKRWNSLLDHAAGSRDTEVRCAHAWARVVAGQTAGLLPVAQSLWTVGRSQPDACDPLFHWLQGQDGISPRLAWERIRLAMEAREVRLILYLARFLPDDERVWVDRWYQQDRGGYRRLDRAADWEDTEQARDIAHFGLRRLARSDPDRAWRYFERLNTRFAWGADVRDGIRREIALWSAVEGSPETPHRMRAVPAAARDDRLLEWWARQALRSGEWNEALAAIAALSPESAADSRWRYWKARALLETGQKTEGEALLGALALDASYHGFLAADRLGLPYIVCPEEPAASGAAIEEMSRRPAFARSLELRRAGVANWSRSEWILAVRGLDRDGLRTAAGLAVREDWPEMAIFALGDSGDLRWYEWRFPLEFSTVVESHSRTRDVDPAWVMGLMRAESAMAVDAVSAAGARGLMQVTPATARQLANRHGFAYTGRDQLLQAEDNIRFGTTYLRDLLDRFEDNPVLASGAYNAGPNAVERWLRERPQSDPTIWVESLPYFETRDYIPRVLAFATIYDWRMQRPVSRVSSRMPAFESAPVGGNMQAGQTVEIVCRATG